MKKRLIKTYITFLKVLGLKLKIIYCFLLFIKKVLKAGPKLLSILKIEREGGSGVFIS